MSENANPTATFVTTKGEMTIELWPDIAPGTVENFTKLANDGFYDGTCFHRIMAGFMIQGGDPQTKDETLEDLWGCLLYTSPSPRDATLSRMPSSA